MEDKQNPSEFILSVKVIPKASRTEIVGWEQDQLKIGLKATPEKGEANDTLIAFLAKTLNIAKSQIKLISGLTSRNKRLKIYGMTEKYFRKVLSEL